MPSSGPVLSYNYYHIFNISINVSWVDLTVCYALYILYAILLTLQYIVCITYNTFQDSLGSHANLYQVHNTVFLTEDVVRVLKHACCPSQQ
jgi:hypothetical protein